jgi:hypothetical protein
MAQPTQSAFADAGATMAAMPMPAAPTSAMSDLCMMFSNPLEFLAAIRREQDY